MSLNINAALMSARGVPTSRPSIVNCDTTSDKNKEIYDAWAANYENDIRTWGYCMPEKAADVLFEHKYYFGGNPQEQRIRILDAGAGDGLSGAALRSVGFDDTSTFIVGSDISPKMLEVAKGRGCYDETQVIDLNKPLPFPTDSFDAVTCIGTLTYVDPNHGVLEEFIRITRPGGLICYTNRTDKMDMYSDVENHLELDGLWYKEIDPIGPLPYLPNNPEYGKDVEVVLYLYRVLDPE